MLKMFYLYSPSALTLSPSLSLFSVPLPGSEKTRMRRRKTSVVAVRALTLLGRGVLRRGVNARGYQTFATAVAQPQIDPTETLPRVHLRGYWKDIENQRRELERIGEKLGVKEVWDMCRQLLTIPVL